MYLSGRASLGSTPSTTKMNKQNQKIPELPKKYLQSDPGVGKEPHRGDLLEECDQGPKSLSLRWVTTSRSHLQLAAVGTPFERICL